MSSAGDVGLARRRLAAALAGEIQLRAVRCGERQHARIDQRVVHDDVGLASAGKRVERQQAGIARARRRRARHGPARTAEAPAQGGASDSSRLIAHSPWHRRLR